jgi:uncharacterized membrane protein
LIVTGLSLIHSLRARGLRRTLLFAALGNAVPVLGELLAVKVLKLLRHHMRPQVKGVPLAIALGWYNVAYGTFAMMECILRVSSSHEGSRALAPAAALTATSLDLLLDPVGLGVGLWQWSVDGQYAAEVEGPNGKHGVPLLNFAGWFCLTASVTLAYQRLEHYGAASSSRAEGTGCPEVGRGAALLPLSYYLPAAAWAVKERRNEGLLYSVPFSAAIWAALKERPATP